MSGTSLYTGNTELAGTSGFAGTSGSAGSAGKAIGGSTLLNGLVGYWKLDETSGARADSGTNGLNLTDNNTVTSQVGKIGNGAAFTAANSEYLSVSDNAVLQFTESFTVAGWVERNGSASTQIMVGQYAGSGTRSWLVNLDGPNEIELIASADGSAVTQLQEGTGIAQDTWTFFVAGYDHASSEIFVKRNDAATVTAAFTGPLFNSTEDLTLGANASPAGYLDGGLDEVGLWSRKLTDAEIADLYNGGSGATHPFSQAGTVGALITGQSNAEKWFDDYSGAGAGAFSAELASLVKTIEVVDGGQSGVAASRLSGDAEYFWDTVGEALTSYYDAIITAVDASTGGRDGITDVVWIQGESDAESADLGTGTYPTSAFKLATNEVFDDFRSKFTNLKKIYIVHMGRLTNQDAGDDGNHDLVRREHQAIADENSDVEIISVGYDLTMQDNRHYDQAGYEKLAQRCARRIAARAGQRNSKGTFGPSISSASYSGTSITVNITHDNGNDLTAGPYDTTLWRVEDDGTPITISSAVRTDATTITLTVTPTIAASSVVTLWYAYDDIPSITTPVEDNATVVMPLNHAFEMSVTEA